MLPRLLQVLPPATRWIVALTGGATVLLSISAILCELFGWPSPVPFLCVSQLTWSQGWLWQIFSYGLVAQVPIHPGVGMVLGLFLELLFLAQVGGRLERYLGPRALWSAWILGTLVGGVTAMVLAQGMTMGPPLLMQLGCRPAMTMLLVLWLLAAGEEVLFLLVAPVRTKWLITALLGFEFLQVLGSGNWLTLAAHGSTAFAAMILGVSIWGLDPPFERMWRYSAPLRYFGTLLRRTGFPVHTNRGGPAIIIDFRTGEVIRH